MKEILSSSAIDRVISLTQKIAPEHASSDSNETTAFDVFSYAAWTGVGEPGDRVVRLLCDALGVQVALKAVVQGLGAHEIMGMMRSEKTRASELLFEGTGTEFIQTAIAEALERWRPRLSESESIAHMERAGRIGATIITENSPHWPTGLHDLGPHRPAALWCRGNTATLGELHRSVSIVGARASTGYGEHVTMDLVSGLVGEGFCIVSGAAYGIDGMAHRAALASGGSTIAVLAGGIDRLYPSGHDALLHRIIDTGVVVTELPCGFAPTKWRFLQQKLYLCWLTERWSRWTIETTFSDLSN
jgi:DNA processing protein